MLDTQPNEKSTEQAEENQPRVHYVNACEHFSRGGFRMADDVVLPENQTCVKKRITPGEMPEDSITQRPEQQRHKHDR